MFDGCRVALHGFFSSGGGTSMSNSGATAQGYVRTILRRTGAIFFEEAEERSVTHVIVPSDFVVETGGSHRYGGSTNTGVSRWAPLPVSIRGPYGPHVVTLKWLFESIERGRALRVEGFKCATSQTSETSRTTSMSGSQPRKDMATLEDSSRRKDWEDNRVRAASAPPSLSPQSKALAARKGGNRRHHKDETANVNDTEKGQVPSSTFLSSSLSSRNNLKQEKSSTRSKPMSGLVVSVSGYSGPARVEVRKISTRLGALYNDSLDRHCAYLVCKKPEGRKYDKACEFPGTQIVTLEWLRACERAQKIVAPEDGVPHGKIFWHKKKRPCSSRTHKGKAIHSRKKRKVKPVGAKGVQISFSDVARRIEKNRRKRGQNGRQMQADRVQRDGHEHASNPSPALSQEDIDFKALQRELLEGGGTGDDLDVGDLMDRVKRNRVLDHRTVSPHQM